MNTRALAAEILVAVIQEGRSLSMTLDPALKNLSLEKDRGFVKALVYGVLRAYWRLDAILNELVLKPIKDERIRMIALLGLHQLRDMRVKPHAAVAETVAATQPSTWAKPLINAVLRNYQRNQAAIEAKIDPVSAAGQAHPKWLWKAISRDWPDAAATIFAANNAQPPMSLRVNLARVSRERLKERLSNRVIEAVSSKVIESALTLEEARAVELIEGFSEGLCSVQDTAAQLACALMALEPKMQVLDLCAAPGGKTAHLLESCSSLARLVAVDVSAERLVRVQENLDRLGLKATLVTGDALRPEGWWDGVAFDRILVDAPCSATGVIRRHPDIKVLRQPGDIANLQAVQLNILEKAWSMLTPGGRLVYATCSILKAENAEVIETFLGKHADASEHSIDAAWGRRLSHGRQILPGEEGMDGFYYAVLVKSH